MEKKLIDSEEIHPASRAVITLSLLSLVPLFLHLFSTDFNPQKFLGSSFSKKDYLLCQPDGKVQACLPSRTY